MASSGDEESPPGISGPQDSDDDSVNNDEAGRDVAFYYSGCSRAGKSPIPDQDSRSGTDERLSIGIHYRYQNY